MKISFLVMQNTHQKLNTKIKLDRKILSDVQLKTFKLFIKDLYIVFFTIREISNPRSITCSI